MNQEAAPNYDFTAQQIEILLAGGIGESSKTIRVFSTNLSKKDIRCLNSE
jgi:hypothetical protein